MSDSISAHKLIESIDTIEKLFPICDKSYYKEIKLWIQNSQKFLFHDFILPKNHKVKNLIFTKLPFPFCYYEIRYKSDSRPLILLLRNHENGIIGDIARKNKFGLIEPQGLSYYFENYGNKLKIKMGFSNKYSKYLFSISELEDDCKKAIATVCFLNSFLSCSNIKTERNTPKKKINKIRTKKNKIPFFSYYTLKLDKNINNKKTNNEVVNSKKSPRIHFRRGHIRQLLNGKNIWVQHCVVGNKKNGIIHKGYEIV